MYDDCEFDESLEDLKTNLKKFREAAENRLMNKEWGKSYRSNLKNIMSRMFELQIELNEL